jgi:hypothetical protein
MRAHRITLIAAFVLGACTTNKADLRTAKTSAYDTDFAIVYSEALAAVRDLYPENLQDDPARGMISTVWHQVQFSSTQDDTRSEDRAMGAGSGNTLVGNQPRAGKHTFIRFDVVVTGGRPWRVRVTGKASEWEAGNAEPTILKGPARPQWLGPRIDALTVAIYRRLKPYAVPIVTEEVVEEEAPTIDKAIFGDIPAGAADVAAAIVLAIDTRTPAQIRSVLADDVIWSLGADGDADTAMAMWQADPDTLATLKKVLTAGCRGTDVVTCPPDATETPGYVGWRVTLEQRSGAWKLTSFVTGD